MTTTNDEAQAMIPFHRIETGRIRGGAVEDVEVVEIPEAYFKAVENSVIEQLTLARISVLGTIESNADEFVQMLVRKDIIHLYDADQVRMQIVPVLRRGVERLAVDARDRYTKRLPITLKSLIPLITRRSGK